MTNHYKTWENYTDVAVIGGGAAGMAAAIMAKSQGAERVVLIEREKSCGGILNQCIHKGFGTLSIGYEMAGTEYASEFRKRLQNSGVQLHCDTTVVQLSENGSLVLAGKGSVQTLKCGTVILASGCYERPIGTEAISGYRPSGVITAGTAQRMMNIQKRHLGNKVIILGSGDVGLIVATQLKQSGASVLIVEKNHVCGGLLRNRLALAASGVPVLTSSTVTELHGEERIHGVTVCESSGKNAFYDCDVLITSLGLIPDRKLIEGFATIPPWLFICGNANFPHCSVDEVTTEAELAGANAASYVQGEIPQLHDALPYSSDTSAGELCIACPIGCRVVKTAQGWNGMLCGRKRPILAIAI